MVVSNYRLRPKSFLNILNLKATSFISKRANKSGLLEKRPKLITLNVPSRKGPININKTLIPTTECNTQTYFSMLIGSVLFLSKAITSSKDCLYHEVTKLVDGIASNESGSLFISCNQKYNFGKSGKKFQNNLHVRVNK